MKNDNLKAIIVLLVACLVVAVLLAGVNTITKDKIAEANEQKIKESLSGLIEGVTVDSYVQLTDEELSVLPEDVAGSIEAAFRDKDGRGWAFIFTAKSSFSSNGPMKYSVGIDPEGRICGFCEIEYMESQDFGDGFPSNFDGKDASEVSEFDVGALKTGATFSAKAFKQGLENALRAFELLSRS